MRFRASHFVFESCCHPSGIAHRPNRTPAMQTRSGGLQTAEPNCSRGVDPGHLDHASSLPGSTPPATTKTTAVCKPPLLESRFLRRQSLLPIENELPRSGGVSLPDLKKMTRLHAAIATEGILSVAIREIGRMT